MKLFRLLFLSLFLLPAPLLAAEEGLLPEQFTAVYTLSQAGITLAELERRGWLAKDGSYIIESVAEPRGLAAWILDGDTRERSQWIVRNGRVFPLRYRYRERGGDRKKNIELEYDWEKKRVVEHQSGKQWTLPENAQDQTSIQFAIMERLRRGDREFRYPMLDGKRIKQRHYRATESKWLNTRLGKLEVIGVQEVKPEGKRYSVFWCARRYGYLPVRIEQHKKGTPTLVTVIERITGFDSPRSALSAAVNP